VNVPSFLFLGFAAVVALAINVRANPLWRRGVLLVANVAFVASFAQSPKQIAPFVGFLVFGFLAVKLLERRRLPAAIAVLVGVFILAFCTLKQYAFLPHAMFLPQPYFTVGLSYIFFRVLHLIIDTYDGTLEGVGPISYLNYTLNFTSFVAGPIQFYPDFVRAETVEPAPLDLAVAGRALERIALGFAKVIVFAPLLSTLQERAVAAIGTTDGAERILAATVALAVYPVFLYLNFAGYTDFVIGVARFLRLDLPENFNAPFVARGLIALWGRWHMTLSNWFKTYVFSPLTILMVRRFPERSAEPVIGTFAFFVTFFLVGLWHGSTSMFVIYGILQGTGVSVNKAYQVIMTKRLGRKGYRALTDHPVYAACSRGLTYSWFAFTLLWFAFSAADLESLAARLGPVASLAALAATFALSTLAIAASIAVASGLRAAWPLRDGLLGTRLARTAWCTALVVIVLSVTVVLNDPTPRVVYKAF
jgi:D-alanyl-lipoteichoic acid acyltransferase DltB (MBOAT superfamily)